jgi:sugar/nucleoside kinase (ribokinase family)
VTRDPVLLGPLSLDRYLAAGLDLPGGGALNMAWHWATAGIPFRLISRIGDDEPATFLAFLERHGIAHDPAALVAAGPSSSIDIEILPDAQPHMDNFVEGVWSGFRLRPEEEAAVAGAPHVHAILVEPVIAELERLHAAGVLRGPTVSGDFLGFRHYTLDRFADTMARLDLGFVGWPGRPDDPEVDGLRAIAHDLAKLVVVTFGAQGVRVLDGRPGGRDAFVPVDALPVAGTTVGCGDAFVAGFLASWWRTADLDRAVDAGKAAGARATAWRRPLPDEAYGAPAIAALRAADAAAGAPRSC